MSNEKSQFSLLEDKATTSFDLKLLHVLSSNSKYKSYFSGFAGILPYTLGTANEKEENFMWQLKKADLIQNEIVSFFTTTNPKLESSVTFGSWDRNCIKEGKNFDLIQTASRESWGVAISRFEVGDQMIDLTNEFLLIEPSLPNIYVPENSFEKLVTQVKKKFKDVMDEVSLKNG